MEIKKDLTLEVKPVMIVDQSKNKLHNKRVPLVKVL
jgi:hypothetical protein